MAPPVPGYYHRSRILGNAIVPGAARLAFFRLYTAFEVSTLADLRAREGTAIEYVPGAAASAARHVWPFSTRHGSAGPGMKSVYACDAPAEESKDWRIVLDPKHYRRDPSQVRTRYKMKGVVVASPLLTAPQKREKWSTICTSYGTGCVLTERMTRDVHTMARFASTVDGVKQARTDSSTWLNINYMEWMMGFPRDHTFMPPA
jgi:hypothetical protein